MVLSLLGTSLPSALWAEITGEEEMMFSEIPTALGTLTQTDQNKSPVSITLISEEMIRMAPARNLYDILEVYVPGFQAMTHFDATHMGLRGLQVDRDYTFLMLVNGRLMNQKSHNGPITELENWDLNDIAKIEVIRGPGSVTYGPGAVAGVISITTKSASTSHGAQAGARYVGGYKSAGGYASASFEKPKLKGYTYASFTRTDGYENPDVFTLAQPSNPGQSGFVDKPTIRYYPDFRNRAQVKFHTQLDLGKEWSFWARYTNSGTNRFVTWTGNGWFQNLSNNRPQGGNRQYVVTAENNRIISSDISVKSFLSWSSIDCERFDVGSPVRTGSYVENYAENDLSLKSTLRYTPAETWKTALGVEYSYVNLGKGWGDSSDQFIIDDGVVFVSDPNSPALATRSWIGVNQQIYSNSFDLYSYAVLGEVSKSVTPSLDVIFSGRADKNVFSKWSASPRFSAIYNAQDSGTVKFSIQRSIRENTLAQIYANHYFKNKKPDPEKFDGVELSYGKKVKSADVTATSFYNVVDLLGWNAQGGNSAGAERTTSKTGKLTVAGVELEAEYKSNNGKATVGANHVFAKQVGFKLAPGTSNSFISRSDSNDSGSDPNVVLRSIGSDRMNWANHRTKIYSTQKATQKLKFFESVRVAWGYEGMKNWLTMYQNAAAGTASEAVVNQAVADARENHLFGMDFRADLSAAYQLTDPLSLTLLGQNIAPLTKQWRYMYAMVSSAATIEPTVFALRADYKF